MKLESITEKKVVKGKSNKSFYGRLFYAIIPDRSNKSIEFFYTKANSNEGRSVARGLPLFIRDYYKKPPGFFCDSDFIQSTLDGDWDLEKRNFLSSDEKEERERLDEMEDAAIAEVQMFVSKDHQQAMALDSDTVLGTVKSTSRTIVHISTPNYQILHT